MATTANYGWTLPNVGGDVGGWGVIVNNAIIAIDAAVKTVSNGVAASLALAGGVMTGLLQLKTSSTARIDLGSISGTHTFDLSAAQSYTFTLVGNLTVAFTNFPAGTSAVLFKMTNAGAFTITWPTTAPVTKWTGASVPVWTGAGGVDRVAFITDDDGVSVHGVVVGKAVA
jgi:hypothetical protein